MAMAAMGGVDGELSTDGVGKHWILFIQQALVLLSEVKVTTVGY